MRIQVRSSLASPPGTLRSVGTGAPAPAQCERLDGSGVAYAWVVRMIATRRQVENELPQQMIV